jgi:hypothetical protein
MRVDTIVDAAGRSAHATDTSAADLRKALDPRYNSMECGADAKWRGRYWDRRARHAVPLRLRHHVFTQTHDRGIKALDPRYGSLVCGTDARGGMFYSALAQSDLRSSSRLTTA